MRLLWPIIIIGVGIGIAWNSSVSTPIQSVVVFSGALHRDASATGFLAISETVADVIARDTETLNRYGITHEQIADLVETFHGQYERALDLSDEKGQLSGPGYGTVCLKVHGIEYEVNVIGYRGIQECPFSGHLCGGTNRDMTIHKRQTNEKFECSVLSIHLIREHHFFEGAVKYRFEFERFIRMTEMKTGVSYTPNWEVEPRWFFHSGTPMVNTIATNRVLKVLCLESVEFVGTIAYILPSLIERDVIDTYSVSIADDIDVL
jgi:hypothetical protein